MVLFVFFFKYLNRDDLVHGFVLVYSTKRKASLATLVAFSQNIPNLPIQILAVTESGGAANAFFSSELSHQLITAGNAAADRLQVHISSSAIFILFLFSHLFRCRCVASRLIS